jgi:hypothetical protein
MPSEVTYGRDGVNARVSWGSNDEGVVQLVTQAVEMGEDGTKPLERLIRMVNQWLEAAGEPTIDLVKLRQNLPYEPLFDGWWMTFTDWGQLNRLISHLKKARDKAFGPPA